MPQNNLISWNPPPYPAGLVTRRGGPGRYRRTEEERVRCFLVRNTTTGQLVAQSADATCHGGLQSPSDGFLTFNMTPAEARKVGA